MSGDPNRAFSLNQAGELLVSPRRVDWRKTGYALGATVGDGANTSAVGTIDVSIPKLPGGIKAESVQVHEGIATVTADFDDKTLSLTG